MRIRSIKPEFWASEDVAALDWPTRLLFIGLWQYVDDNGVGRDVPKLIVADLFPLEDNPRDTLATVSRGLQQLSARGLLVRYEAPDGKPFLYITGWEHQRIDRPGKPRYPLPPADIEKPATPSRHPRESEATVTGEQRNRGTEELELLSSATPPERVRYPDQFEEFWKRYPRKVGKDKAARAWKSALRRATLPEIAAGLSRMLNDPNLPEMQFIPHPTTWLNAGGWNDGPLAPRNQPGTRQQPPSRHEENAAAVRRMREREQGMDPISLLAIEAAR